MKQLDIQSGTAVLPPRTIQAPVQSGPLQLELVSIRPRKPAPPVSFIRRIFEVLGYFFRRTWLFLCVVVIPVGLAAVYLFVFANDRYQSEARFVIRNSGSAAGASIGAVLGPSITSSLDDAYAVNSYIVSPSALADLSREANLIEIFSRAPADPLWMYPPFYADPSNETLYKRYLAHIDVKLDKTGGISTLTAQAFTAEDALLLATQLLKNAETLVNNLGSRSRNDAISNAANQLNEAKARVDAAQLKITEFRNRERVVDPTRISNAIVETIARLSTEIAETKAQQAQLKQSAKRSPQLASLGQKIVALENQVILERQQLAGSDAGLAQKIAEYETLVLEKGFAEKLLAAASNSVESARLDAQRQQVYLERIVSPELPDDAFGPKRSLTIIIISVLCFFIFSTLRALSGRHRKMHKSTLGA